MKIFFIYSFIIFLAVILQISSIPLLFQSNWPLDIVLMLVLAWTLLDGFEYFLKWAIFAGLLYDIATFSTIGIHVLIFSLLAYSVSYFSKRFSVEIRGTGILLVIFFVGAATAGSRVIALSHEFGLDVVVKDFANFWPMTKLYLLATFGNLLIFFLLFYALGKIEKFYFRASADNKLV